MAEDEKKEDYRISGDSYESLKQFIVQLDRECHLHAKKGEPREFCRTVRHFYKHIQSFAPKSVKSLVDNIYAELDEEVKKISSSSEPESVKEKKRWAKEFEYAEAVYDLCVDVLMNSPIVSVEVEGYLDITNDLFIEKVRGGKRGDAKVVRVGKE